MKRYNIQTSDFDDFTPNARILSSRTLDDKTKYMDSVSFLEQNRVEFHVYVKLRETQVFTDLQSALNYYNKL